MITVRYRAHRHQPGDAMGSINRPTEVLELARCRQCRLVLVKPEGDATADWQTCSEYGRAKFPPSTNSLI